MTPLDFIAEAADNQYNTPAGNIADALRAKLKILSGPGEEWVVLSYYYDETDKCMTLDIEKVVKK